MSPDQGSEKKGGLRLFKHKRARSAVKPGSMAYASKGQDSSSNVGLVARLARLWSSRSSGESSAGPSSAGQSFAATSSGLSGGTSSAGRTGIVSLPTPTRQFQMKYMFGLLFVANFLLGGYMMFNGRNLVRQTMRQEEDEEGEREEEEEEEEERRRRRHHKLSPPNHNHTHNHTQHREDISRHALKPAARRSEDESRSSDLQPWEMEQMIEVAEEDVEHPTVAEQQAVLQWVLERRSKERVGWGQAEERRKLNEEKELLQEYIKARRPVC